MSEAPTLSVGTAVEQAFRCARMRKENRIHNVPYLVGDPGMGKTAIISHETEKRGWGFIPVSLALETKEKFGGIPDIFRGAKSNKLETEWSIPELISQANALSEKKENVVILLDDFHLCEEDIQSIGFELFTYWKLHGHSLQDNIIIILAGNLTSAAGAQATLTPILNRCTLLKVRADFDYWVREFAFPNKIHPSGISFLQNQLNRKYFHENESTEPFGSPRSWTSVFNNISDLEENEHISENEMIDYLRAFTFGSVSPNAAQEFLNYYLLYRHVNIADVFGSKTYDLPEDPITKYAFSMAVTQEFLNRYLSNDEYSKTIYGTFIEKLSETNVDLSVASVLYITNVKEDIENKLPGGNDILRSLLTSKAINVDLMKKLTKANFSIGV